MCVRERDSVCECVCALGTQRETDCEETSKKAVCERESEREKERVSECLMEYMCMA